MEEMETGLVLSAGGMFGAWEVGVWKVLSQHIEPSLIVGASAGAWVGWALAGGLEIDEIERRWLDPSMSQIMHPGLHRSGILLPDVLYEHAQELYNACRPRIPFGLTMVELPSLRQILVRDGAITWKHLAATSSIPFCFPPVEIDGHKYVDGGFRGALPTWAAQEMGATRVIALNVLTGKPFRILHKMMRTRTHGPGLEVILLEPETPLGSVRDAGVWSAENVKRWIEMGERDGLRALPSITM
jgi:NTE family protein